MHADIFFIAFPVSFLVAFPVSFLILAFKQLIIIVLIVINL